MPLLRVATLVAFAAWIGGLAALGFIAAPAVFSALEAHDPVNGRATAGLVFGEVFLRFQRVSWVCGALVVLLLGARARFGPRPRRLGLQFGLVSAMLAASLYTALVITPRIDAIRRDTVGSVSARPEGDPLRAEFGRLHGLSNGLMLATLLAGVFGLTLNARD